MSDGSPTVCLDLATRGLWRDPIDLSIPVRFEHPSVAAYHLPDPHQAPVRAGTFVGDVREGGSVNCAELTIYPHGNGTHTECAGHLAYARLTMERPLIPALLSARVISVDIAVLSEAGESYRGRFDRTDSVVTRTALERAWDSFAAPSSGVDAIIIRTLPNDASKVGRRYSGSSPPYLTAEAMNWLVASSVKHVLIDLPSLDREDCGGTTPNHRAWFGLESPGPAEAIGRPDVTITELIFVPDAAADGDYLLNLQTAPMQTDAVPSRPLIFRCQP